MSSADRGETWTTAPLPDEIAGPPLRQHGFVGMDYNHPDTLYLGAAAEGLWRSTDGGAQWQKRHPYYIGPVAVGFDSADTSSRWPDRRQRSADEHRAQHRCRLDVGRGGRRQQR